MQRRLMALAVVVALAVWAVTAQPSSAGAGKTEPGKAEPGKEEKLQGLPTDALEEPGADRQPEAAGVQGAGRVQEEAGGVGAADRATEGGAA